MSFVVPELVEPVKAFATALGIGLLIGMERERRPDSAAGLRTFSLVAMLGCLFALLDERSGSTWMLAVGLLVIAGSMIASNFSSQQEEQYRAEHHARQVDAQGAPLQRQWDDRRRQTEDEQDVHDVGARYIADRHRTRVVDGGVDSDGEFGQAGADRHDRQAHQQRGHAEPGGDTRTAPDQCLGTHHQRQQTRGDKCVLLHPPTLGCRVDRRSRLPGPMGVFRAVGRVLGCPHGDRNP